MFALVAFLSLPLLATAQLVPTAPGPGNVFKQGDQCTIQWTADPTGQWKQTNIELMTGPNQQMVHLATVATVDGTDPTKTSVAVPCLAVSPSSAIYFYQFTAQGQNATWTGRFAISDPSGATTPPPNAKQPNGENIPWGTGKLLDASQGSPPPPTAPSGQVDGSGSSSAAPVGSGLASPQPGRPSSSAPSATPAPSFVAVSLSSSVNPPTSSTIVTVARQPTSASSSASTEATPAGSTANNNGASIYHPSSAVVICAVLMLVVAGMC